MVNQSKPLIYIIYTKRAKHNSREVFLILEGIFKGLVQWIYGLLFEIVEYIVGGLLDVFNMDLSYFETVIPVTGDIVNIIIACGWALLLGNLVFQAAKSMMSGLGFEGEDPQTLFARTFVFAFLLLASRQICEIGLGLSGTVIEMLQVPSSVSITVPDENVYGIAASWLLAIIVGVVLMWQIVRLFFEIGERYFLVGFLTLTAPLAFAMGGSKNTADIFKGWARMYASMCLMMVLNVVFLKMLISAMGYMPSGAEVLPWLILVVAVARVARKIDNVVARIGLNPAITGDGLGRGGLPGMLSYMVVRTVASNISRTAAGNVAGKSRAPSGGAPSPVSSSTAGRMPSSNQSSNSNRSSSQKTAGQPTSRCGASKQATSETRTGTAGTPAVANAAFSQVQSMGPQISGTAGMGQNNTARQSPAPGGISRRSSVPASPMAQRNVQRPGSAGMYAKSGGIGDLKSGPPPAPGFRQAGQISTSGTAGSARQGAAQPAHASRYSVAPPGFHGNLNRAASPGSAGTAHISNTARTQVGGSTVNASSQSNLKAEQSSLQHESYGSVSRGGMQIKPGTSAALGKMAGASGQATRGSAGMETRRSALPTDKSASATGQPPKTPGGFHGSRNTSPSQRDGRNAAPAVPKASDSIPARQENAPRSAATSRLTKQPAIGSAGRPAQNSNANVTKKPDAYRSGPVVMAPGTNRLSGMERVSQTVKKQDETKPSRRSKGEDKDEQE